MIHIHDRDWSLTDPTGASSSGSVSGIRGRREQALLAARGFVLVNGMEAWVGHAAGASALASQRYAPGVVSPDEARRIVSFEETPWPKWRYKVEGGAHVTQEVQLVAGHALVAVRWSLVEELQGFTMHVRPFISGRAPGGLHHRNPAFREHSEKRGWKLGWKPYEGVPEICIYSNGKFDDSPHWYENFQHDDGSVEDLFAPGVFHGPLMYGAPFELIIAAGWDEVIGGMILPENPVLWAESESAVKRTAKAPPKPAGTAVKKKRR